jgi:hypothetical protein
MMEIAKAFVVGVVTIGLVTALMYPGRQTAQVLKAAGDASSKLLATAESGH